MTMTNRDREDFDSNMRVMIESIASLQDAYSRRVLHESILEESLSSGRMSDFLFEADEEKVKESLQDAVDNATKLLDSLEKAGKDFPSVAIQQATSGLRDKLSKISMTGKTGGNFGLNDLLGKGAQEISHVGESIGVINNSILSVVTGVSNMLKTTNIKAEEVGDQTLKDLVKSKKLTTFKNEAELQKAVKDIVKGGVKQKAKGMLAKIVGFFKGSPPVNLDVDQFGIDILDAKIGALIQWTKSDSGQAAQSPEKMQRAVADPVQQAVKDSGASPKELQAAAAGAKSGDAPAAASGGKLKKSAAKAGLVAALKTAANNDEAAAGKVADAMLNSRELASIFEEGLHTRRYIHQMSLSSLLFEKIEFDTIQKVVKDEAQVKDEPAAKKLAAAAMKYFKDQKLDVGEIPPEASEAGQQEKKEGENAIPEKSGNLGVRDTIKSYLDVIKGKDRQGDDATKASATFDELKANYNGAIKDLATRVKASLQSSDLKDLVGGEDKAREDIERLKKTIEDQLKLERMMRRRTNLLHENGNLHIKFDAANRWARLAGIREDRRR